MGISYLFTMSFPVQLNIVLLYLDPEKRKKGLKLFRQPMDLLMVRPHT